MRIKTAFSALLLVALATIGCGDDGDEAPSISISSERVTCVDDVECIEFTATPDADVILVRVNIDPPSGESFNFNLQSTTVISGQSISLQGVNEAYRRSSGEWRFTFVGNLASGDRTSFEVVATLDVGA